MLPKSDIFSFFLLFKMIYLNVHTDFYSPTATAINQIVIDDRIYASMPHQYSYHFSFICKVVLFPPALHLVHTQYVDSYLCCDLGHDSVQSFKYVCNYVISGIKYLHAHLVSRLLAVHRRNPEEQVS